MDIDVVIAYVNMDDQEWLKKYYWYCYDHPIGPHRYRDYGTLRYVLRGIETHMKFIRNIYLVVATEAQIPGWLNQDSKIKIVYHKDFIPEKYLPTFNCNVIEAYMHRIPGLAEHFIYINDDMIPTNDMTEDDFFIEGKPCIYWEEHTYEELHNPFFCICLVSDTLAKLSSEHNNDFSVNDYIENITGKECVRFPQHTLAPMIKSLNEQCISTIENLVHDSFNKVRYRTKHNMNQYMFTFYYYYIGKYVWQSLSNYFVRIGQEHTTPDSLMENIMAVKEKTACINDYVFTNDIKGWDNAVVTGLNYLLPNKSSFEK